MSRCYKERAIDKTIMTAFETKPDSEKSLKVSSLIKFNDVHPMDMTKDDWVDDFNNFYDTMRDSYPYFWVKERVLGYNWLDLKDRYMGRLEAVEGVQDILAVFWDAVTALQDTHTIIWLPRWMSYHFREDSFFQQREPYKTIFSDEVREASEYWKPVLEEIYTERDTLNYEVLILYTKGNYVIVDGHGSWKDRYGYGTKIIAVNGIPIDSAIRSTYEKEIIKWDFDKKKPYQISITPKLFGVSAVFTIETAGGETKDVSFDASTDYRYNNAFNYPSEWLTTRVWPDEKIAYIRFRNFELDNVDEGMHDFLIAFYTKVKDYDHLIVDVRGNSGGWNQVWVDNIIAPLIKRKTTSRMYVGFRNGAYVNLFRQEAGVGKAVAKESFDHLPPEVLTDDFTIYDGSITVEPSDVVDFNARISLLIDNSTWSASAAFALFCKETNFAKLYGTATKGEAVSSGTIFYVLPNSKIVIRFNPCMGLDNSGRPCEEVKVQPDVYYESDIRNQDELIEYIIKEIRKSNNFL
jgi:C-terminal processing protease CtpA/Prc